MPVEGLPSSLESMLNVMLQEMELSSFKIEGRDNHTVVVLRLATSTPAIRGPTPSATHVHARNNNVSVFRRKCPSQVSRDKKRAEAYRTKQKASLSQSPSGLFLPTPPSLFYNTYSATAVDTFQFDSDCVLAWEERPVENERQLTATQCVAHTESAAHDDSITLDNDCESKTQTCFDPNVSADKSYDVKNFLTQTDQELEAVETVSMKSSVDLSGRPKDSVNVAQEQCAEKTGESYAELFACVQETMKKMDSLSDSIKAVKNLRFEMDPP